MLGILDTSLRRSSSEIFLNGPIRMHTSGQVTENQTTILKSGEHNLHKLERLVLKTHCLEGRRTSKVRRA